MKLKLSLMIGIVLISICSLQTQAQSQLTIAASFANKQNPAYAYSGQTPGWTASVPLVASDYIVFDLGDANKVVTLITLTILKSGNPNSFTGFDIQVSNTSPTAGFSPVTASPSIDPGTMTANLNITATISGRYIRFTNFRHAYGGNTTPTYLNNVKIYGGTYTSIGNTWVNGSLIATNNVGIGCSNPIYPLCVNGKIQATEVEVKTAPCSDYVFEPDYELKSLREVEQYVIENKHLPEVPSAAEYSANGYNIGEFDNLMLRKVEELTLYLIEQDKRLLEQNNTILEQNKKIEALETELNATKQEDATE